MMNCESVIFRQQISERYRVILAYNSQGSLVYIINATVKHLNNKTIKEIRDYKGIKYKLFLLEFHISRGGTYGSLSSDLCCSMFFQLLHPKQSKKKQKWENMLLDISCTLNNQVLSIFECFSAVFAGFLQVDLTIFL